MAVQIRCPYCEKVLYIKEEEFDIETRCSHCQRAFIWSNILEKERWKKENLKRWQESERQKEGMRQLEEVKKSRELHTPEYERATHGSAAPVRFKFGLFGALVVIAAAVALAAIVVLAPQRKSETEKRERDVEEQAKKEAQKVLELQKRLAQVEEEEQAKKEAQRVLELQKRLAQTEEEKQAKKEAQQREQERWSSPAFYISAEDLYRAYRENEIRADSEYKGKILAINGKITDISRDTDGKAYICLAGSGRRSAVQCFFPKSEEGELEQFSKGDQIYIVGECKGMMFWNVLLYDCKRW